MSHKLSVAAALVVFSWGPASAGDDLCSLVKTTVASFSSGGWSDFRGPQQGEPIDNFAAYSSLKVLPGFDACRFMGGDVSGMKQRILTCRARIAALDVSNKKVKEVGDVLHKCLSTRSEGQATNDKQDTRYFQMENLAMVSVNATASGFLVDADTVGVALEISMIVGPQ